MSESKTFTLTGDLVTPFNINEGIPERAVGPEANQVTRLPSSLGPIYSADDYASLWNNIGKNSIMALAKDFQSSMPPSTQSFGRMSYMPNNTTSQLGVLQWPGLPPETLQKLGREMIGPLMIINQRCNDVIRYSQVSREPWRPGWKIHPIDDPFGKVTDASIKKEILQAELFIKR